MAKNYLYMFEFVVDDLLITHPNDCAPEEYPICVELEFRTSVFVSICDKDFGGCLDTRVKNGKCVLFALENAVTDNDKLLVTVAKKKIEKCKFLLGTTEVPIKGLFDKVMEDFMNDNPYFAQDDEKTKEKKKGKKQKGKKNAAEGERAEDKEKKDAGDTASVTVDNMDNDEEIARPEEFCPSSEIAKKLLSIYDRKGRQTGNIVLVMRLSCMGPTIVSPFPFGSKQGQGQGKNPCQAQGQGKSPCASPQKECKKDNKRRSSKKKNICDKILGGEGNSQDDCVCEECEQECEEQSSCSNVSSIYPCFVQPRKPAPGPEAFDEFEANFNGSGLTIRVLKDSHQVTDVADSDYETDSDSCSSNNGRNGMLKKPDPCDPCGVIKKNLQSRSFVSNTIQKNTGGKFINQKGLPRIQGNLKYRGNQMCGTDFQLPIPINPCEEIDKLEKYRKQPPENRNCCLQVEGFDIDRAMKGLMQKAPDGLEICHRKCVETDADVFVLKLGKKQQCRDKKNLIEVELRTPKEPRVMDRQKITRDTQVDQYDLDAALKACGKKGKGKGKKGKKGKKKKKKK